MKYTLYGFVLALVVLTGCEDFEDDNYDFSNSLAQYVEFSTGSALAGEAGTEAALTVRLRQALTTPVTVSYDVAGDFSTMGTTVIDAGNLSSAIIVMLPGDVTTGSVTVSLTGVDNNLSIGRGGPDAGLSPVKRDVTW